jgi:hypothetical protein
MAMIHINRDRKTLGKFSEQDVADGLKSGRFLPTDLAWRDPMPAWEPLSSFTDLPPATEPEEGVLEDEGMKEEGSAGVAEPAWERGEGNFPAGTVVESVRQVLAAPVATFRRMPSEGGFVKPLLFYILTGWASGSAAVGYQLLAALINPSMVFGDMAKDLSSPMIVSIFVGILVFLPVFLIFGLSLSAAFFHLALMMTGAAAKPFEATFRALAYAQGATSVLQFVPVCGGYLYPALSIVYSVLALREVHQADLWRVVLAAVLLFLLFCGLAMGAAMLFVGLGAAMAPAG